MRDTLHWLPVENGNTFKIILMRRTSMIGAAPEYISELCAPVSSQPGRRSLRSAARGDLIVPRSRTSMRGQRAFSCIGPSYWNGLPLTIRNIAPHAAQEIFLIFLKSHLFKSVG